MTPQLQQAIALLQLSLVDLQQEIQDAVENNPLLEVVEDTDAKIINFNDHEEETLSAHDSDLDKDDAFNAEETFKEPSEFVDDYKENSHKSSGELDTVYQGETQESLHDYLHWQLNLGNFSPLDHEIALSIIDSVDDEGYLRVSLSELRDSFATQPKPELAAFENVLQRIWLFDPVGVGARDLRECLKIQLSQIQTEQSETMLLAQQIVDRYLEQLAKHDLVFLAGRLRVTKEDIEAALSFILLCHPKPGLQLDIKAPDYVIPDVYMQKYNEKFRVFLNGEMNTRVQINRAYAALIKRRDTSEDNQYLKKELQEARWFIKSLENRNSTLLKVATAIVDFQEDFFNHGEEAMKPMVLSDIATKVGLHESTISRITTRKYMHTPRGLFELKYFFSSQLSTERGGACSSTAIRAVIKKMVQAENRLKPLSDEAIAKLLQEQGFHVARRTVAKYREAMGIVPSHERNRMA